MHSNKTASLDSGADSSTPFSFHDAKDKRFAEVIVLVPYFRGTLKRIETHVAFLNDMGFDVAVCNIRGELIEARSGIFQWPVSSEMKPGLKYIWADVIEKTLNSFPGSKIVFTMSNPSAAAITVIARRNAADVRGLVCDSGPTNRLLSSVYSYITHVEPISFVPLRWASSIAATMLMDPFWSQELRRDLDRFPQGFPLLSIRGWKDKITPPQTIDEVFDPHLQLNWQKLSIPAAGHLNGLRDFADEYRPGVERFLKRVATSQRDGPQPHPDM
jgi:hypothetical protein